MRSRHRRKPTPPAPVADVSPNGSRTGRDGCQPADDADDDDHAVAHPPTGQLHDENRSGDSAARRTLRRHDAMVAECDLRIAATARPMPAIADSAAAALWRCIRDGEVAPFREEHAHQGTCRAGRACARRRGEDGARRLSDGVIPLRLAGTRNRRGRGARARCRARPRWKEPRRGHAIRTVTAGPAGRLAPLGGLCQ